MTSITLRLLGSAALLALAAVAPAVAQQSGPDPAAKAQQPATQGQQQQGQQQTQPRPKQQQGGQPAAGTPAKSGEAKGKLIVRIS